MSFWRRSTTSTPDEPQRVRPKTPGAMLFTLRSVPRHHDELKAAIESHGDARVYFSEPLAYIRGKGVALFRVEATDTAFVDALYETWREVERREAFRFDIFLYVHNTELIDNLRGYSPEEVKTLIQEHAPTLETSND